MDFYDFALHGNYNWFIIQFMASLGDYNYLFKLVVIGGNYKLT